jgi:two-component system osmolarity sensor histidine kinase EnvZ
VRLSLFWRTFALIALLIIVSLAAWLQLFRAANVEPAAERFAWEAASLVNLTRAGLLSTTGPGRSLLLADLAREEGIRVLPAEPGDRIEDWPDTRFGALAEQRLRERLGPAMRLAGRVNGTPGLWIGFEIDADPYWLLLDPQRLHRPGGRSWLGWLAIALTLSVLGALAISRVIHRPLSSLAGAIDRLSREEAPEPLPEVGPTELAEVNRRFNRMAHDLHALEQDRAEALAGISHDIRTPLTRLRMEIELAPIDAAARASMADEIERIDAIVRQFVDFAQPVELESMSDIDLTAAIDSVVAGFTHGPDAAQLSLHRSIRPGTHWHGSQTSLARILSNLLENARRYGADATGHIRIDLSAQRLSRGIELCVRDHGPGVPVEQLERLQRPFARADAERSRFGGSGLGLAIVGRLARRHGGSLQLELPTGGGLLARVHLQDAVSPAA